MADSIRDELRAELDALETAGLGRRMELLAEGAGRVDFTSNDYLGLARHPEVIEAARAALAEHGAGARGSRLLGGGSALDLEAEAAVADWLGAEAALLFASGFLANLGLVTALAGRGDAVLSDALNHASLIDASRLSGAEVRVFAHGDLEHLAELLRGARGARRRLVVTEGVFSMDGDLAPLAAMHRLCADHDAWLIVDEAHAVGVVGPHGAGAWAEARIGGASETNLAARVVTGGKALGVAGGLVVGSRELRALVSQRARSFIYATGVSPAIAGGLVAAVRLARGADGERERLDSLACALSEKLELPEPQSAIVPIVVGENRKAMELAARLSEEGLEVRAVRPPTVPEGTARLRCVLHSYNTEVEIERLASTLGTERPRSAAEPRRGAARPLFVVGTDTGIGKTVVSALLVRAAAKQGATTYWKPVQTGDDSDTETVRALAEGTGAAFAGPTYAFPLPASPHEAAADVGDEIVLAKLDERLAALSAETADGTLLVELAGGLLVPYDDRLTQADWLARIRPRIVLVARSGLGTLNHTLLTLEALRARRLIPEALFLVGEPHPSNRETLRQRSGLKQVFELPILEPLDAAALDQWIRCRDEFSPLRGGASDPPRRTAAPPRIDEDLSRHRIPSRDRAVCWHPYTQHGIEPDPLPVAGARGSILVLEDGREVIDAISSWWACLHGHSHPRLVAAMQEQAARLDHVLFAGATHEPAVALAEELLAVAPRGLTRVFYSDDGSTAVEVALKMVRQLWCHRGEDRRRIFVAFEGAYHGDTFGAMAVGDPDPFFLPFQPLLFEVRRTVPEIGAVRAVFEELGERCAGVILEPLVQGAAGMLMQPPEFLRELRDACDAFDLPWIADEVMTGFGRTGKLFACDVAGVSPDLLCLAKGLTGGAFPLAATLTTERFFEAFLSEDRGRAFFHGHTFTGNPVGCAVARASLAVCAEERTPARLAAIGSRIEERLREVLAGDSRIRNLRRTGGIVAFDLAPPPGEASGYLSTLQPRLRAEALVRGVLLRPLGNVLYALPPSSTSEAQCDRIAEVLAELVDTVDTVPRQILTDSR